MISRKVFRKVLASVFIAITAMVVSLGWKPATAQESVQSDSLDVEQRLAKVREYVKISQETGNKDENNSNPQSWDKWNNWNNFTNSSSSPSPSPSPGK